MAWDILVRDFGRSRERARLSFVYLSYKYLALRLEDRLTEVSDVRSGKCQPMGSRMSVKCVDEVIFGFKAEQ